MATKEYTIIVENGDHWSLHCLAGYSRERAEERLAYERSKYHDFNFDIEEYTAEEAEGCWWNKWGCN